MTEYYIDCVAAASRLRESKKELCKEQTSECSSASSLK